jgi:putative exosortase-associated protein (TIGR04073 family)
VKRECDEVRGVEGLFSSVRSVATGARRGGVSPEDVRGRLPNLPELMRAFSGDVVKLGGVNDVKIIGMGKMWDGGCQAESGCWHRRGKVELVAASCGKMGLKFLGATEGPRLRGKEIEERTLTSYSACMKAKLLGLFLIFAVLLPLRARAQGEDAPTGQNALRKLGRGIANVLFGIVEMPNQVTKTTAQQGGGAGVTYGVGKGFVRWMGREFTGVYDVVTFPVPYPKGYKPIMKPEFPAEDYEP